MAFSLIQKLVRAIATGIFRGDNGENFVQAVFGLPGNINAEGARLATKAPWLKSSEQPNDALVLEGEETLLNAMPSETPASYRARLADRWNIWPKAGNPATIEQVLASGGFPLTVVERQDWPLTPPVGYWSLFWLLDETNSIPAGPPDTYGSGVTYGTPPTPNTGLYGMTQVPFPSPGDPLLTDILSAICLAVRKTRPAHVILEHIIVPGTAPLYGDPPGFTYGGGATYGGTSPVIINCS